MILGALINNIGNDRMREKRNKSCSLPVNKKGKDDFEIKPWLYD